MGCAGVVHSKTTPSLIDRHTERADRFALLTEPDLRRLAKEPDQSN
jgi:hypothetical protein